AYIPGGALAYERSLVWVDRHGQRTPLKTAAAAIQGLQISPDGGSVALDIDAANANIWILDLARGQKRRLTLQCSNNGPAWAPDGTRSLFTRGRGGAPRLFWQPADGSGQAEPLTSDEFGYPALRGSWSPDGKRVVFQAINPEGQRDIWVVSVSGDRKPAAFLRTPFDESLPTFSPDGRFIAYLSNET